jgi:hypothetical protein
VEAFEQVVKVFLEAKGYVVTSNVKFPVRRKTKRVKYDEYQTHGYEVDIVAARHDSLILGSVKSFFGSVGVNRQGFRGIADNSRQTHFQNYTMFNEREVREGILLEAEKRYGYPQSQTQFYLFAGKFKAGDEIIITDHLSGIEAGAGPVRVVNLESIVEGLLEAAQSKTYYNDPVVMTLKALKEAGMQLKSPKDKTTLDFQALRTKLRGQ